MKCVVLVWLIFNCFVCIEAQDKKREILLDGTFSIVKDECGNYLSASESQTYDRRKGKIVKIIDGNTIVFESKIENGKEKKDRFTVDLAGVNASKNTRNFLKDNLLNEEIEVWGNTLGENDKDYFAIVFGKKKATGNVIEINCFLIREGITKYKKFESNNLVPDAKPYFYLKAEEKAKLEELGIWAK